MSDEELEKVDSGRRDFLKKSLAAGAVVWSAPAVTSLPGGRAWAQTYECPTPAGPCQAAATGLILTATAPLNINLTLGEAPDPCVLNPNLGFLTAATICGEVDSTACTAHGFIENLVLTLPGLVVTAVVLDARASTSGDCPPCGTSGSATIVGVVINGTPITIPSDPCNDVLVNVPGVATVILNEQRCDGDTLTVNALHVRAVVPVIGTVIDLIAGQAIAGRTGCTCTTCV